MKKITLILSLLLISLSFAQTVVEDFDPNVPAAALIPLDGFGIMNQVPDPDVTPTRGDVLRLVTNDAAVPWQGARLVFQGPPVQLIPAQSRELDVWVYSIMATDILAKVTGAGPDSATDAYHNGTGWEQLTFDFAISKDNAFSDPANGIYSSIIFYPAWRVIGGCIDGCYPDNPAPLIEIFIDEISFGAPAGGINWTGTTNNDWNIATNWSSGLVPTASDDVNIPISLNAPIANAPVNVSSMTIESGASFIANAAVLGDVTYQRNLSTSNWYYVSSPVNGANVDTFVLASGLEEQGTFKALCSFDTAINNWVCYEDGTNFEDTFTNGKGYIVNLLGTSGNLSFTGTMNTVDQLIPLDTTESGYNLLGNPFTSFINTGAMLSTSSTALETETIWVFNASTNSYETKVTADNFQLAPGQGFFIQSNGIPGNVAINEAFQSHQNTDTFLRTTTNRTEVYLTLTDGSIAKNTRIYYIDGATTGFDNGYDGPMFRAFSDPFSIYTHLIADDIGIDMGVQSIPNDNYENLVVPIGITATSGVEISISANAVDLPQDIDLFIEDRDNATFTLLDANSNFTFIPANSLNGVGRFYLHMSSNALSIDEDALVYDLQIYTAQVTKELVIDGQLSASTVAYVYDVQGRLLLKKVLEQSSTLNTIDISNLSSGTYIVKVDNDIKFKTQKIIIK